MCAENIEWIENDEGILIAVYDPATWQCDFIKNGYRLATEAEWEYAARGGLSDNRFPWVYSISHSEANYYSLSSYYYDLGLSNGSHPALDGISPYTSPVESFSGNGYGLHDMAGNVWEWCNDWYGEGYSSDPNTNPTGPITGSSRVLRGGGCGSSAYYCRVATCMHFNPSSRDFYFGFRVCREQD